MYNLTWGLALFFFFSGFLFFLIKQRQRYFEILSTKLENDSVGSSFTYFGGWSKPRFHLKPYIFRLHHQLETNHSGSGDIRLRNWGRLSFNWFFEMVWLSVGGKKERHPASQTTCLFKFPFIRDQPSPGTRPDTQRVNG